MTRDWRPGDVAVVRNEHGVWNWAICTVGMSGNTWRFGVALTEQPVEGSEARPLVVVDPESVAQVNRLADAFCRARWSHVAHSDECDPLTRSSMREALAVYLAPKPDEPTGLGAVVEDAEGDLWVRWKTAERRPWRRTDHGTEGTGGVYAFYADIAAVKVLSEGVTP